MKYPYSKKELLLILWFPIAVWILGFLTFSFNTLIATYSGDDIKTTYPIVYIFSALFMGVLTLFVYRNVYKLK